MRKDIALIIINIFLCLGVHNLIVNAGVPVDIYMLALYYLQFITNFVVLLHATIYYGFRLKRFEIYYRYVNVICSFLHLYFLIVLVKSNLAEVFSENLLGMILGLAYFVTGVVIAVYQGKLYLKMAEDVF